MGRSLALWAMSMSLGTLRAAGGVVGVLIGSKGLLSLIQVLAWEIIL
jgi:hypothetical protein